MDTFYFYFLNEHFLNGICILPDEMNKNPSWAWWWISILAVGTLSQEDPKFQAKDSLSYVVGPCLKTKVKQKNP